MQPLVTWLQGRNIVVEGSGGAARKGGQGRVWREQCFPEKPPVTQLQRARSAAVHLSGLTPQRVQRAMSQSLPKCLFIQPSRHLRLTGTHAGTLNLDCGPGYARHQSCDRGQIFNQPHLRGWPGCVLAATSRWQHWLFAATAAASKTF